MSPVFVCYYWAKVKPQGCWSRGAREDRLLIMFLVLYRLCSMAYNEMEAAAFLMDFKRSIRVEILLP